LLHERDAAVEPVAPPVILAGELPSRAALVLPWIVLPDEHVAAMSADVVEGPYGALGVAHDDDRCRCRRDVPREVAARARQLFDATDVQPRLLEDRLPHGPACSTPRRPCYWRRATARSRRGASVNGLAPTRRSSTTTSSRWTACSSSCSVAAPSAASNGKPRPCRQRNPCGRCGTGCATTSTTSAQSSSSPSPTTGRRSEPRSSTI